MYKEAYKFSQPFESKVSILFPWTLLDFLYVAVQPVRALAR